MRQGQGPSGKLEREHLPTSLGPAGPASSPPNLRPELLTRSEIKCQPSAFPTTPLHRRANECWRDQGPGEATTGDSWVSEPFWNHRKMLALPGTGVCRRGRRRKSHGGRRSGSGDGGRGRRRSRGGRSHARLWIRKGKMGLQDQPRHRASLPWKEQPRGRRPEGRGLRIKRLR